MLNGKSPEGPAIPTMEERMQKYSIWLKVRNHAAAAESEVVPQLKQAFGVHLANVFKTITADNGLEVAELSARETAGTSVYFTHPFSSWEEGTNECHNKLLWRFIPKGKTISNYSPDDILFLPIG